MDVIAKATLVTGSPSEPEYHAPGAVVGIADAEEAAALIARGLAAPAGPLPEVSQEECEAEGTGEALEAIEPEAETEMPADDNDGAQEAEDAVMEVKTPEEKVMWMINQEHAASLTDIKGVGKKTANDIIASREADGPFTSFQDCADRVGGVSVEMLQQHPAR